MSRYAFLLCLGIYILMATAVFFATDMGNAIAAEYRRRKKAGTIRLRKQGPIAKFMSFERKRSQIISQLGIPGPVFGVLTALGIVCGAVVGKVFFQENIFSLIVGSLGAFAPFSYFQYKLTHMRSRQVGEIQSSMMILSNSYIVTGDLLKSVQDNIELLEAPEPFRDFLTFVTLINGNIKTGLRRLELQVDNIYFSQWVDVLIMAQDDRSMKYVTMSVVDAMNDVHQAQREADTAMYAIWHEYITVLILIFSAPMIFRVLMHTAYTVLVTTLLGQALLTLLIAAVVYSLIKAIQLNKPLLI